MLSRNARARLRAANERENQAWQAVTSRAAWEAFRDRRIRALRESLGPLSSAREAPACLVTRTFSGDGFRIENLVIESQSGVVVTANLYAPSRPPNSMPAILICHSHHNPKTEGELQDMGMTWARAGCLVLVIDQIGHGERRQHPFSSEKVYPQPYRAGRQDYYFRFVSGLQLQLVGESLMGWMVRDVKRGLDLLLSRPGVDTKRVIMLGAVAGGGDIAAVTAALDPRVCAVVPFNFGGPQPDYAIPAAAERDFYYFGVADWESTRCLRLGARDGFAHWVIDASVAPRRLIYAHEFAWDRLRDPVWSRLQRVFCSYQAEANLAVATGRGTLKGSPPASSHCNNIGPLHRSRIYPILSHWFQMPIPEEYSRRRARSELECLTPEAIAKFHPRSLHDLAAERAGRGVLAVRREVQGKSAAERRRWLCEQWSRLLGSVEPGQDPRLLFRQRETAAAFTSERIVLEIEPGIIAPLILLVPSSVTEERLPVVVGVAQEGKQAFLHGRSGLIGKLLEGGASVCLLDVRGTGETSPGDHSRGRNGTMTELSATEWLLGQTLVGSRLRDVRALLRYLRGRQDLDPGRIALWGDSFAPANPPERDIAVPMDVSPSPGSAEPLGGLLALFAALFEPGVRALYVRGGLSGYGSLLHGPFCYIPHDALVPGALTLGDLCNVAAAIAPRPVRMEGLVDGLNRAVAPDSLTKTFADASESYRSAGAESDLEIRAGAGPGPQTARWLLEKLSWRKTRSRS
jgi:dienelactone hydrolase